MRKGLERCIGKGEDRGLGCDKNDEKNGVRDRKTVTYVSSIECGGVVPSRAGE